jgi:hypothetical protein
MPSTFNGFADSMPSFDLICILDVATHASSHIGVEDLMQFSLGLITICRNGPSTVPISFGALFGSCRSAAAGS